MPMTGATLEDLLEDIRDGVVTPVRISPTQLMVPPHLAALLPNLAAKHGFDTVEEFLAAVLAGA